MTSVDSTLTRISRATDIAEIIAIVARDGGVIIEGFLEPDQVARFNAEIEAPLQDLAAGSTHELAEVQEFHGANTKRLTNLVTHSPVFREEVIDHDLVHALCDATFLEESGTYWMTTAQVIEIGPGNAPPAAAPRPRQLVPVRCHGPGGAGGHPQLPHRAHRLH